MQHLVDEQVVTLGSAEVAGLIEGDPGPLAPRLLRRPSAGGVSPEFPSAAARDLASGVVAALSNPLRRIDVHTSSGDDTISRHCFVPMGSQFAGLSGAGDDVTLGRWTAGEIEFLALGSLALAAPMGRFETLADTTPEAVIVLIAIADALRLARMEAMVDHAPPPASVSVEDVMARIADAASEDFRWPLCMIDKLLPRSVADGLDEPGVVSAIEILADGGAVSYSEPEGQVPGIVAPSHLGEMAVLGLLNRVGATGITVSRIDGASVDIETLLLVREPQHLWCFGVAPERGVVSCLGPDAAMALIRSVLSDEGRERSDAVDEVPPPPPPPAG